MNGFITESSTIDGLHNCPQQRNNDCTYSAPDEANTFYLGTLGTHCSTNHLGRDTLRSKRRMADAANVLGTICVFGHIWIVGKRILFVTTQGLRALLGLLVPGVVEYSKRLHLLHILLRFRHSNLQQVLQFFDKLYPLALLG